VEDSAVGGGVAVVVVVRLRSTKMENSWALGCVNIAKRILCNLLEPEERRKRRLAVYLTLKGLKLV